MVMPVEQICPECGETFLGSDAIGFPCDKCHAVLMKVSPPPVGGGERSPVKSDGSSGRWYIARGGKASGPMSLAQLHAVLQRGDAALDDFVWRPGFSQWRRIIEVDELTMPPPVPAQGTVKVQVGNPVKAAEPPSMVMRLFASAGLFALSAFMTGVIREVAEPDFERVFAIAAVNIGTLYGIYYVWAEWGKRKD